MSLQPLGPLTRGDLIRFDLRHAMPTAFRVLRRRFGVLRALGVMLRYGLASVRDPLRSAASETRLDPVKESLTRHQLRAAVRLDDALASASPGVQDRLPVLRQVIGEAGAAFIRTNAPMEKEVWRAASQPEREAYAASMMDRFPNAKYETKRVASDALDFDVTYCRLAELCRDLGRPHLAPLFCFADAVYFDGKANPSLHRDHTIAEGADRCTFRIGTG